MPEPKAANPPDSSARDNPPSPTRETTYVGWRHQRGWDPITIARAEGSYFWDDHGQKYLDLASQLVATNLGHGNPAIIRAIQRQATTLAYASPSFDTEAREQLSSRLLSILPAGLDRFFFSLSGTEANEAALKIARDVTGRSQIVARTRSYHGSTAASISVSGDPRRVAAPASDLVGGTVFAPDCYCYRCPFGLTYPSCGVKCADEVGPIIDRAGDVAAMILEPVVGTNGVIPPVPEYLPRIRALTRARGVLLIADEVMTGFGRTGRWFAVDHWDVTPDILTSAKGLTNGAVPLGLTATTSAIHASYLDRYFPHGHTYERHPLALAAASAAIDEYRRLDAPERSRQEGLYLLGRLREMAQRHPSVGEVRGLGLFAAIELVRDRATREPFNPASDITNGTSLAIERVLTVLRQKGIYAIGWGSHILIAPPLVIPRAELDLALGAIGEALGETDRLSSAS
jgi:taurine---2-oxoglutarate transaminase